MHSRRTDFTALPGSMETVIQNEPCLPGEKVKNGMVNIYRDHKLYTADSLIGAAQLDRRDSPVVCAVGAGGKTSLLRALAEEYGKRNVPVAVTTTTHIKKENRPWFLTELSLEKMREILKRWGQVWIGLPSEKERLAGVPEAFFLEICKMGIPVLVEADGAKMLPLKYPGLREPVIPRQATHVFSVYGLDGLGEKIEDVCFRPEQAAHFLGKQITDQVAVEDIARMAASKSGGRKGCPPGAVYTVVLNKADDSLRTGQGKEICAMLERKGVEQTLVTSLKQDSGPGCLSG